MSQDPNQPNPPSSQELSPKQARTPAPASAGKQASVPGLVIDILAAATAITFAALVYLDIKDFL